MLFTLRGIIKRGKVLKVAPFLFFPIENYKEIDYLPVKEGFFLVTIREVKGKIKSVYIHRWLFPKQPVEIK